MRVGNVHTLSSRSVMRSMRSRAAQRHRAMRLATNGNFNYGHAVAPTDAGGLTVDVIGYRALKRRPPSPVLPRGSHANSPAFGSRSCAALLAASRHPTSLRLGERRCVDAPLDRGVSAAPAHMVLSGRMRFVHAIFRHEMPPSSAPPVRPGSVWRQCQNPRHGAGCVAERP
jgi:hypothetical protein